MVFKLVALVYLLMNGQSLGEPQKFTNKIDFPTLDTCVEAKDSPSILASRDRLSAMVESSMPAGGSFTITLDCEKFDDGTI